MTYSQAYINTLNESKLFSDEWRAVIEDISEKITKKERVTLAEEQFVFHAIVASRDSDGKRMNPHDMIDSKRSLFIYLFQLHGNNLSGQLISYDALGEIDIERKKQDIAFLDSEYIEWNKVILNERHKDVLLQEVAIETRKHLKQFKHFVKNSGYGSILADTAHKRLILFSKYSYLLISRYYEELGKYEQELNICGKLIVANQYTYVHTLFRHYAENFKPYQGEKSYYYDTYFDFENIPNIIINLITDYFSHVDCKFFNDKKIYIKKGGQMYVVYFEEKSKFIGRTSKKFLRVQTFYPVELKRELQYASTLKEIIVDDSLSFFY